MKEKRIEFECYWNWNHWYILPAISLDNYLYEFEIHFNFMGLLVEISFIKNVKED